MMIDDIVLIERLANNTGLEDTTIKLSAISARLTDDDGSETLALTIEAIPVGTTLSDGTRSFTATTANHTALNKGTLSKNSDGSYTYTPRRNYTGTDSFTYTVNDGGVCQ